MRKTPDSTLASRLYLAQLCAISGIMGFATPNHVVSCMNQNLQYSPNKKALLIGINYVTSGDTSEELRGPQKDVNKMRELLINTYGYKANNIVTLSDKIGVEDRLMPTKANIMRELYAFLSEQKAGDQYTFLFSGHTSQRDTDDEGEQDGKDELIETSDGEWIVDDTLHDLLVKRLLPGSRLVAVFDTCHSGTLLDLPHGKCNRVAGLSSSMRRSVRRVLEPLWSGVMESDTSNVMREIRRSLGARFLPHPFCLGYCPRVQPLGPSPNVLCISACKDSQEVFETDDGKSLMSIIAEILKKNPHPTLKQLMRATSDGSHALNHQIALKQAEYIKRIQEFRQLRGLPVYGPPNAPPELKYKRDPQLSSLLPLRMNSIFDF